jgi:hypothetical protein
MKHKHAEWIKRFVDGEHVEYSWGHLIRWYDIGALNHFDEFAPDVQFRVKPKDDVVIEICLLHEPESSNQIMWVQRGFEPNLRLFYDVITNKLKSAEVL